MVSRSEAYFSLWLCVIILSSSYASSPPIKDKLEEHFQDAAHKEGAETVKLEKQKVEKIHEVEKVLSDVHKNHGAKANDEAKYVKKEHDSTSSSESDAYDGYNAMRDKAEDSQATGFKKGHKKGHHKQGFQNSYHKDESSSKSTFFDDLNDENDAAGYNSRLNSHDNHGGRSYQGAHNTGKEHLRDDYYGGGYNRHADHGNRYASHKDHGKNYHLDDGHDYRKHYDDRNLYDRGKVHDYRREYIPPPPPPPPPVHHDSGWDWNQWDNARRGWERPAIRHDTGWREDPAWDYGGPGYYDDRGLRHEGGYGYGPNHGYGYGYESRNDPVADIPKDAPVVAHRKQTITIYEDPRYDGKDKGQLRREEGDYLQLEYKPSGQRYASYDDTYYVPARNAESSEINRLVYNYKRQ